MNQINDKLAELNMKEILKIHGYDYESSHNDSDSGKSSLDEDYEKIRLPPIPYEKFKDRIVVLESPAEEIQRPDEEIRPEVVVKNSSPKNTSPILAQPRSIPFGNDHHVNISEEQFISEELKSDPFCECISNFFLCCFK